MNLSNLKNPRIATTFDDGSCFVYSTGRKDNWKLSYHERANDFPVLLDRDYLAALKTWGDSLGDQNIYHLFTYVYDLVTEEAQNTNGRPTGKQNLASISWTVQEVIPNDSARELRLEKLLTCFYLTMVSEWYYPGSKLHHRVKRLAVYQVLILGWSPDKAATFSRGKSAGELDEIMKKYGF